MAELDIAAKKKPFPYGRTSNTIGTIRRSIFQPHASQLNDSVHGAGGQNILAAIDTMGAATSKDNQSVIDGVFGTQPPRVVVRAGQTHYQPYDEAAYVDPDLQRRYPAGVVSHEGTHALQTGKDEVSERLTDGRTFGALDKAARELGPSLIGHLAETEARRRSGRQVPNANYQFPSGYSPSLEFMRQQADRFGLFSGANNGNIDEQLAKNPQWLRAISQPRPAGEFLPPLQPPTREELDRLFGVDDTTTDVNPAGSSISQRLGQRDIRGQLPSAGASGVATTATQTRSGGNTVPAISQDIRPLKRVDYSGRPQGNSTNSEIDIPQKYEANDMAGLDIAAGYRPSVPVNKKSRIDKEKEIYNAFYGHADDEYVPGSLQVAREAAARGGVVPGSSSNVRPMQTASAVDPRIADLSPFDAETLQRGNATGYYARPESSIRRIADDIFKREQAEIAYPSTDAGIIDFRNRQSARDRAAGLNIGRRTGGQGINPMMPGTAGMGSGPSNTNYGGQGARTNYFINRENVGNEDPRTAERQQGLTDLAMIDRFAKASGISRDEAIEMNQGQSIGAPTDAASRMNALRQIGGPKGAADAGLLDRYVSGSSLTRTGNDSPERTAMLDNIAAIRQREKERKAAKLGDVNDPNSIAGRLQSRGLSKGDARAARMAARASGGGGGSQEDMILQMAMNGNPAAMQLAGMIAQGNREVNVQEMANRNALDISSGRNKNDMDIATLQYGPKQKLSPEDQYRADTQIWADSGGEGVLGPFDEWREKARRDPSESVSSNGVNSLGKPSDIASTARWGGAVTSREGEQLSVIVDDPNLSKEEKVRAIIKFGKASGWDDNKTNLAILNGTGDNRLNTEHMSSWGNPYFFGNRMTNPDTGAVESDWDRWKRRLGIDSTSKPQAAAPRPASSYIGRAY